MRNPQEWLDAVLADPRVDDDAKELARFLASETDERGHLSPKAQAVLENARRAS